jgi:hypothetical protein
MKKAYQTQNKRAEIRSRVTRNGKLRTETHRRDPDTFTAAISTDPNSHATAMYIDIPNEYETLRLSGAEARTLYRLLSKHFEFADKPL